MSGKGWAWRIVSAAMLVTAAAGGAQAQSMSTSSANFNGGYSRTAGSENSAVTVGMRDANGNLVIVDGLITTGVSAANSVYARVTGAASAYSGAGSSSSGSTAIGNNLNVSVTGDYNTVIVNSTQTNTGDVTATSDLNGKVNIDGGG